MRRRRNCTLAIQRLGDNPLCLFAQRSCRNIGILVDNALRLSEGTVHDGMASTGRDAGCRVRFTASSLGTCPSSRVALLALFAAVILAPFAHAQDNYEIQVYGSDIVPPRSTMVEIHSNFTVSGSKTVRNGVLPTNHAEHETLELTQGINAWAEVGFYVFTSIQPGEGWQWVGDHIRPRVRAPETWHRPVGVSLSTEIGYQRAAFSPDTWTFEIRPIIDRKIGPWYLSFNPALDRSFHGPGVNQGVAFSPNVKVSYDFTKKIGEDWSITRPTVRCPALTRCEISSSSFSRRSTSISPRSGSSTLESVSAQPAPQTISS